jgi:glutamine cyclotransferase
LWCRQGLFFHNGRLYESTGLYGQSSLQVIDPETGAVLQKRMLPRLYFAEGITIIDDVVFLLTWRERVLLRVDAATLETLSTHPIKTVTGEGWGITHTPGGEHLILSDGSELLYFLDPATLKEVRRVPVTLDGKPVRWINELEYIDGYVFANVWYQHWILKIDPASGHVVALLDLRHVNPFGQGQPRPRDAVLNGIAFDSATRKLYITGKLWPAIYVA